MEEATYCPLALVTAVRTKCVPSLVSVTPAFGTTAPAASVTVPTIVPLRACDHSRDASNKTTHAAFERMCVII